MLTAKSLREDARSVRRREDLRFITGTGSYLDDQDPSEDLHGYVLRSPYSHADIVGIDVRAAEEMAGVRALLTHVQLTEAGIREIPCYYKVSGLPSMVVPPYFPLARDRVRYTGDPVAFVVADTPAAARDAAEAIVVEYRDLPCVTEAAQALHSSAPQLWEMAPGNLAYHFRKGDELALEQTISQAAHVAECEFVNNRVAAAALEPRVAIGSWCAEGQSYHLQISGASVHGIRRDLAEGVFGIPSEQIEVSTPDVGGGFGMKNITYPEYALVLLAARMTGRRVRWLAERMEDFVSGVHGRDNVSRARLALDGEGRFIALAVSTIANLGAYMSSHGPVSSTDAPVSAMGGLYDIPLLHYEARGVFTNTAPVDAYRGAGKPEANYIVERLIDIAACNMSIDPVELRRRNLIRQFPHRSYFGSTIDVGDFAGNLEAALQAADYAGFDDRRRGAAQSGKLRGIGVSCFLETARGQPDETARLSVGVDGLVTLAIGTQSNGQGHETSFLQIAADKLQISADAFRFLQGDTSKVPSGGGHAGARSIHLGGQAILLAADALIRAACFHAAEMLQVAPKSLRYEHGYFYVNRSSDAMSQRVSLTHIANHLALAGVSLGGLGENICSDITFPNGCHVAEVEVDPQTGNVTLDRYTAVDDYGYLVNPLLVEGQIHGGLAQGIGQAMLEHIRYDASNGQLMTAAFTDYAMPRAADLPNFDVSFREIPTQANMLGVKGSGQAGSIGAPQTIVNAVLNALRPMGVTDLDMPLTPQRVWKALQMAADQESSDERPK